MKQLLTEGSQRALERATRLAAHAEAESVEPWHLLWSLLREESHAAEIMIAHGLSADVLATELPLEATQEQGDAQGPADLPQSDAFQSVVLQAQRQAASLGRHVEVGSEFLLWGLAAVESPVAELLHRFGLDAPAALGQASQRVGVNAEPLDVDFSLTWRERTAADHTDTFRILDAAANRAREGIRVVEDFVRFTLDDAHLTGRLKHCRHALAEAFKPIGQHGLLAARDTRGDVGTTISTPAEAVRLSPLEVVRANLKRVQEALRTLEEFGKIVSPVLGESLGQIRYEFYTLEKAILTTESNRRTFDGRRLYLLVSEDLCHHGAGPAIREALAAGVGVVQVREKSMPDRRLIEYGRRVREWTRQARALFIMNDRPDLAVLTEADGVHVGQEELTVREARRIVGPDRLIGVSTHTMEQARRAVLDGADYLGVGPVYPSTTKSFDELAGLEFVRQAAAEITLSWFAIGGIRADNVAAVTDAGATRIAVSSAICGAEHPGDATGELLRRLAKA